MGGSQQADLAAMSDSGKCEVGVIAGSTTFRPSKAGREGKGDQPGVESKKQSWGAIPRADGRLEKWNSSLQVRGSLREGR